MATPRWWKIILINETKRKNPPISFFIPIAGDTVLKIPFNELPFRLRFILDGVKNYNNYLDIYERCSSLLNFSDIHEICKLAHKWQEIGKLS